jgi:autotransporter translocation and assembly factor TamB
MRRIRPGVVAAGCLLAALVAVAAVLWRQGDFWRTSAANYLRERLAAEFGAQFQTNELRGRWFPPGLSLGRVTLHRPDQPWVLTAEDVRISLNPYAVLFGRERLGRVVIERPRLFVRAVRPRAKPPESPTVPGPSPPATPVPAPPGAAPAAAPGAAPGLAARLRPFLRPPFPLRVLEIVDGRVDVVDGAGGRAVASEIDLSVFVSSGLARAVLEAGKMTIERGGRPVGLGRVNADVSFEDGRVTVRELVAAGGPLTGTLQGTVDYGGALALKGELSTRLEEVAALIGRPGAAGGAARFEGAIAGNWRRPEGAGTLAVRELVVGGRRLPPARGQFGWAGGHLSWSRLSLPVGAGSVTSEGEADFSGGAPRYRIAAEARAADPAELPAAAGTVAERLRGVSGTLRWEGSGTGPDASGSGSLAASFTLASWPGEEVSLEAAASLDRGGLSVGSFRGATRSLEFSGAGSWNPGAGYSGRVAGTVGDLARLLPAGSVAFGGSGSFEGDLAVDAQGPRFSGAARLANASIGRVRGIGGSARLAAAAGSVRLSEGAVDWPGGRGGISGTIEIPSGRLDLAAVITELSLAEAAPLFGADPRLAGGTLGARLLVRGAAGAPEIEGEVTGRALRYRTVAVDEAALSLSYASQNLGVTRLRLRRGTTELTFRGQLREGRAIEGEFESPAFDLADFTASAGTELAGALRGRVRGTLADPQVKGTVRAGRLRYAGFDLKGGELSVDYRGGAAAVEGWVAAPENRLRLVVEPGRDWRFKSDLELRQFAPEMVRSGLSALPPALAAMLGKTSFLATGRLAAAGQLRDLRSVRADLQLDTLWIQAAGTSLQNPAPVRISWRDGGLAVEDFRVAGEQYHLEIRGGGSLAGGWSLQAEGAVDLAGLKEYWREIEDLEGLGDLRLSLSGPWSAPVPEGSVSVSEAFVRVRSLPEPLEHLQGRLELRGRTLTATGFSGAISGGAFRCSGSYHLAQDRLDAQVEGRLDLALFRGRIQAARELRGPVEVRLRLAGALAAPSFSGEADVLDAEMFWRAFPAKITHLRGRVLVGGERLEVRELVGQIGGGTLRLSGTMDWSRAPVRVEADLEGKGLLVSLAGDLKALSDLRLSLRGDYADLRLAGEVRILKARYLREFSERPPPLLPPAGQAGAAAGPDLSRMALDVKVTAADNVWIDNRMAKIETAVALEIGGRLGAPVVRGEITAIQGEASYLSRQFRLESGSLRFAPPATVPLIDLQASTSVGETQIYFLMDGPLNKPSSHLTSMPAMSQEDLVALLTIGETRSGLARRGDRASTAGAAVFTTEPLVNALGDEVRSSLGLDVLQLEPVVGDNQQVSARVTLGTRLSDRLFVSYSQNLGATEDQQFLVQYSLLDYLSVWGQELSQGVYSLDLVFRYSLR